MFNGLSTVNVELSSKCNKNCWMCGRRKIEKNHPEIASSYGYMKFELVKKIAQELPKGIVVQLHNNGEPLLYPKFEDAIWLFSDQIRCLNTNGKLLVEKADKIIGNIETLTISIIENDPDAQEQYEIIREFLEMKGEQKPYIIYRCLGNVDINKWKSLPGIVTKRILHNPMGSFQYEKETTIPEIGICLDMLNHIAIDRFGKVSICVRFDPKRLGVIGDINKNSLDEIWNSSKRLEWLQYHISGNRKKVPLCSTCDFWGVPRG